MANDSERALRADARRTRTLLLDVLGELLETRGLAVSLPELAREAGVSVATVYRHFDDVHDLRQEFYDRTLATLIEEFARLSVQHQGLDLYYAMCRAWVEMGVSWARAGSFIRSPEGFIERVQKQEPLIGELNELLRPVVHWLMAHGIVAERNVDYATLLWVTLFDERVFLDLESALAWNTTSIADRLAATYLNALQRTDNASM
jgi:AcrR family transcriptional regulator